MKYIICYNFTLLSYIYYIYKFSYVNQVLIQKLLLLLLILYKLKKCIAILFILIYTYFTYNLYRPHLVSRRWWFRPPRDAHHAPHQRFPSLFHAWWRHGLRGLRLRAGSRRIWRHCRYIWRLGLWSWLWRLHDVNRNIHQYGLETNNKKYFQLFTEKKTRFQ